MSHTFYGYPAPSYPPRLYAQEPTLASNSSSNNDADMMGFFAVRGMAGGRASSSGYAMDSSYDPPSPSPSSSSFFSNPDMHDMHDTHDPPIPPHPETELYLRRTIGIPEPRPVSLWGVSDGRKLTTTEMARLAIWGSDDKRLTLAQIFQAVEARYPAMREAEDKPWRRSIRHNLSLKDIFQKEDRPNDHPGKGCYWILNVRHGEACSRKKREGGSQGGGASESEEYTYGGGSLTTNTTPSPGPSTAASSPQSQYSRLEYSPRQGVVGLHHHHGHHHEQRPSFGRYGEHGSGDHGRSYFGGGSGSGHSGYHHHQHQHQQPPHAINPRLTMGNNYVDTRVGSGPGPALQPLVHHLHHSQPHHQHPSSMGTGMGTGMGLPPPGSSSRRPNHLPISEPSRRRTHDSTFGFDDDEDSKARAFPKPRRTSD